MKKSTARNAFEHTYNLHMKFAKPNGINHDYNHGVLKGIVDMAFMAEIITMDELKVYYKEIKEAYAGAERKKYLIEQLNKAK